MSRSAEMRSAIVSSSKSDDVVERASESVVSKTCQILLLIGAANQVGLRFGHFTAVSVPVIFVLGTDLVGEKGFICHFFELDHCSC